jgi:hypothetical protein
VVMVIKALTSGHPPDPHNHHHHHHHHHHHQPKTNTQPGLRGRGVMPKGMCVARSRASHALRPKGVVRRAPLCFFGSV